MVLAAPAAVPQGAGRQAQNPGGHRAAAQPPNLRDVPTVAELNLTAMQSRTWSGARRARQHAPETVDRLVRDIAAAMAMPEVREILLKQQVEIPTESVEQFPRTDPPRHGFGVEFVKANGIKAD